MFSTNQLYVGRYSWCISPCPQDYLLQGGGYTHRQRLEFKISLWRKTNNLIPIHTKIILIQSMIKIDHDPWSKNPEADYNLRNPERYVVNAAHTESYKNSTVPYCQRLLNEDYRAGRAGTSLHRSAEASRREGGWYSMIYFTIIWPVHTTVNDSLYRLIAVV